MHRYAGTIGGGRLCFVGRILKFKDKDRDKKE